ncbi:hypothetical protein ACXWTF_12960 [Thiomicrolovo sp. ZZH C-3]
MSALPEDGLFYEEEEEVACGCDCGDYDEEDFEDFDEELDEDYEEKPKRNRRLSKAATAEDYLERIKQLFDHVTYEIVPFTEQPARAIDNITASTDNYEYVDLVCQKRPGIENQNPNIEYETWCNLKIRVHHDFVKKNFRYVVENYEKLVVNEDISFFDKENPVSSGDGKHVPTPGINYYLLYSERKNNLIPTPDVINEKRKAVIRHVFQNGIYENDNPRLGYHDGYAVTNYTLSHCSLREHLEERGGKLYDHELTDLFYVSLNMGIPEISFNYAGKRYVHYPYSVNGYKDINDSSNNARYAYDDEVAETYYKDYLAFLREFTGIEAAALPSTTEDAVDQAIVELLRGMHEGVDAETINAVCMTSRDATDFQHRLNAVYPFRSSQPMAVPSRRLFDFDMSSDGNAKARFFIHESVAKRYGWNVEGLPLKWSGSRIMIVFEGSPYEHHFKRLHPPAKALDLFDDEEDENEEEAAAPAAAGSLF